MKDIYNNKIYLQNNPDWHADDAQFKANRIIALLNKNNIAYKTVTEIGCGSGEILVQMDRLVSEPIHFTGYDISKDAIEIARQKESETIKFHLSDFTRIDENYSCDLLLVIDVIEHVKNYFELIEGVADKGLYTVFHIPLDMHLRSLFREQMLIESKNRVGHIHHFTEDFIKNILTDYGFEIIDQQYTPPIYKSRSLKQKIVSILRLCTFKLNKRFCTKFWGGYSILLLTRNRG